MNQQSQLGSAPRRPTKPWMRFFVGLGCIVGGLVLWGILAALANASMQQVYADGHLEPDWIVKLRAILGVVALIAVLVGLVYTINGLVVAGRNRGRRLRLIENASKRVTEDVGATRSLAQQLTQLDTLHRSGVLTDEQFEQAKNKLVS